jgi:autotransporter passenger strand-loop-strand repeat protein
VSGFDRGAIVSSGQQVVYNYALGATVWTSGVQTIASGDAQLTTLNGGAQYVSGEADDTVVNVGGLQVVVFGKVPSLGW